VRTVVIGRLEPLAVHLDGAKPLTAKIEDDVARLRNLELHRHRALRGIPFHQVEHQRVSHIADLRRSRGRERAGDTRAHEWVGPPRGGGGRCSEREKDSGERERHEQFEGDNVRVTIAVSPPVSHDTRAAPRDGVLLFGTRSTFPLVPHPPIFSALHVERYRDSISEHTCGSARLE
jgi:hypothetical protein